MDRRQFLYASTAAALGGALSTPLAAAPAGTLEPPPFDAAWRTFEVVTDVEIWPQDVPAKVWLPLPLYGDTTWQRALDVRWTGNAAATGIYRDPRYGAPAFYAQFDDRAGAPKLQVTQRIATRNRSVDLARPGAVPALAREEYDLYVQPTAHIPTDGIVRATATKILPTASGTAVERARAIYEWIVVNTYRDPKVIGCGTGDIRFMLETGNLGGKCADLNALFVGLARTMGIPACAWPTPPRGRASAGAATSPRPSTAARSSGTRASAGSRSIPPTCARWCWRRRASACCRSTIRAWRSPARRSSVRGR